MRAAPTGQWVARRKLLDDGAEQKRLTEQYVRRPPIPRGPVLSLLLGLTRLGQSIARSVRNPEFRALLVLYLLLLAIGTVFYTRTEGWRILDALYFCVVTLATVGYGDFAPRTSAGKVFTIVYILIGAGVFVVLAAELAVGVIRLRDVRPASDGERETAGSGAST